MLRSAINVCDRIIRPFGNQMLCREAKDLSKLPKDSWPKADAVIAMAFAQRKDGSLNLPTQSIVKKTFELYDAGLAPIIFSFGSGRKNEKKITEAGAMASGLRELGVNKKDIIKIENPEDSDLALKESDMALLGQELDRLGVKTSYLVAHPLHLWRARLLCENNFPKVAEKVCKNPELEEFITGHRDRFRYDDTAGALIVKGIMSEEERDKLLAICPESEEAINRLFQRCLPVEFYPIEAERIYDWESNQLRCWAEIFFIPWNILAFAEHFIKGKI